MSLPKSSNTEEPPSPSWCPLSRLPYDMAINCLARVSKRDMAALSLVSKRYHSLAASSTLYKIRSLMGCTETYIYVCLRTSTDPNPSWYILRRRVRETSDLIPIPSRPCQAPEGSSVVALNWGIYVIGGWINGNPTSDVWLLDCRIHTWRRLPSMRVARSSAAADVVDGKIYVLGGCKFDDCSLGWGEVFNSKTETWSSLSFMPDRKNRHCYIHSCAVRDGKVYAIYSPSEGNRVEEIGSRRDWCMIDNLFYSFNRGRIFWCEQGEPEMIIWWNKVKDLEGLSRKLLSSRLVHFGEQLVDLYNEAKIESGGNIKELACLLPGTRLSKSRGNLVLFWDEILEDTLQIWCAEISLERRQGGQIWGNIEWSHPVMTYAPLVNHHFKVLYNVSVTM